MTLSQVPIIKVWGEDSANVSTFTQSQIGAGIVYQSDEVSNQVNGFSQELYKAVQYLQNTGGLYNATIPYAFPQVVSVLTYNNSTYTLSAFVRTTANAGTTTNNPPISGATITTTNGIDVYSGGTNNTDWRILKDFDYYNFYVKYPYVDAAGTIQEQIIANNGSIVIIKAILGTDATGAAFILDILNNGTTVKKSADTYTFADVTGSLVEKTDADTAIALTAGQALALRIHQVGSTVVGQDLRVQVVVART